MEQKKENMNAKTSLSITYMYIRFDLDSRKLLSVLPNLFISLPNIKSIYFYEITVWFAYSFVKLLLNRIVILQEMKKMKLATLILEIFQNPEQGLEMVFSLKNANVFHTSGYI